MAKSKVKQPKDALDKKMRGKASKDQISTLDLKMMRGKGGFACGGRVTKKKGK